MKINFDLLKHLFIDLAKSETVRKLPKKGGEILKNPKVIDGLIAGISGLIPKVFNSDSKKEEIQKLKSELDKLRIDYQEIIDANQKQKKIIDELRSVIKLGAAISLIIIIVLVIFIIVK